MTIARTKTTTRMMKHDKKDDDDDCDGADDEDEDGGRDDEDEDDTDDTDDTCDTFQYDAYVQSKCAYRIRRVCASTRRTQRQRCYQP